MIYPDATLYPGASSAYPSGVTGPEFTFNTDATATYAGAALMTYEEIRVWTYVEDPEFS